jgi:hypothetical protein
MLYVRYTVEQFQKTITNGAKSNKSREEGMARAHNRKEGNLVNIEQSY